jgi:hypothetical protein
MKSRPSADLQSLRCWVDKTCSTNSGPLLLATANLRSEQVASKTDGVSYAIKLAIDFFAAMAVTILMIED